MVRFKYDAKEHDYDSQNHTGHMVIGGNGSAQGDKRNLFLRMDLSDKFKSFLLTSPQRYVFVPIIMLMMGMEHHMYNNHTRTICHATTFIIDIKEKKCCLLDVNGHYAYMSEKSVEAIDASLADYCEFLGEYTYVPSCV